MENSETDLEKLCRLCLSSDSENLHHIFEQELSNKIIILSGLEVNCYFKVSNRLNLTFSLDFKAAIQRCLT